MSDIVQEIEGWQATLYLAGDTQAAKALGNAVAEIKRLRDENATLAAHQCPHAVAGEHGDMVCSEIERLQKLALENLDLLRKRSTALGEVVWERDQLRRQLRDAEGRLPVTAGDLRRIIRQELGNNGGGDEPG